MIESSQIGQTNPSNVSFDADANMDTRDQSVDVNSRLHMLLRKHLDLVEALAAVDIEDDTESVDGRSRNLSTASTCTTSIVVTEDNSNKEERVPPSTLSSDGLLKTPSEDDWDVISVASFADFGVEEGAPWYQRIFAAIASYTVEIVDALSETNEDLKQTEEQQQKTLNLKMLRRNVKHTLSESHPYLETGAGLRDIFLWKNPLQTFMTFCVYMYCVIKGWLISLALFLLLLQLGINYLATQKKISIGLTFLPQKQLDQRLEQSMELNGAPLVLDIARRAQEILDVVAESLEKLRHLLLWKRPKMTMLFCCMIVLGLALSTFVTSGTFMMFIGIAIGIRLFITTYLFYRFPRLRPKLDIIVWFMDRLPADEHQSSLRKGSMRPRQSLGEPLLMIKEMTERTAFYPESLLEAEIGPAVEHPRTKGRKCVLIDKERSFPYTIGSGTIYITENHLLFKYARFSAGRRETCRLHFDDILNVKKFQANSLKYCIMPGSGRAIEVYMEGREKPYLFIGISKRDEFYDALFSMAKTAGANFAQ